MPPVRKNKNNVNPDSPAARQEKRKLRRGIVLLVIIGCFIIGCLAAAWWLKHRMLEQNQHFMLRRVTVESSGFWGKNVENRNALIRKLDLNINKDNLFDLDMKKLRSQLRSIPNISDAQVCTILPDTVAISIEERIPRAFLGRPNAELVTDANGMVMAARQCFGVHPNLPVILAPSDCRVYPGVMQPALREALALIMAVQRYKCFSVALISLRSADELFVLMDYRDARGSRRYHVTMHRGNYPESLDILRSAIEEARRRGDDRPKINMTYANQVVLSR